MKTLQHDRTPHMTEYVAFGIDDRMGRRIGALITFFEVEFVETEETAKVYYTQLPGHYFAMHAQAARHGHAYGASQPVRYFSSRVARDVAREAYLTRARKRAARVQAAWARAQARRTTAPQ